MAFQFPAAPTLGQVFEPLPGISYKWNGTGWAPLSPTYFGGVTFTGPVLFPDGTLNAPSIAFTNEPDLGFYRGPSDTISATGELVIRRPWATLKLDCSPATGGSRLIGAKGSDRWILTLGSDAAETGSNVGSDFTLKRYADNGAELGEAMFISRATGDINISQSLRVYGSQINSGTLHLNPQAQMFLTNAQRSWTIFNANTSGDFHIWDATASASRFYINGVYGSATFESPTSGFQPTAPARAALRTVGPYGGGMILVDGSGYCGMYANNFGANLEFGLGTASGLTMSCYFTTTTTTNRTGSWATYSDADTKDSIVPYTRGLADLVKLEPVSFVYREGTPFADDAKTPHIGLVAQDVQPYVPEVVSEGQMVRKGEREGVPVLMLQSGNLIYAVLNSLRELNTRLEALENK